MNVVPLDVDGSVPKFTLPGGEHTAIVEPIGEHGGPDAPSVSSPEPPSGGGSSTGEATYKAAARSGSSGGGSMESPHQLDEVTVRAPAGRRSSFPWKQILVVVAVAVALIVFVRWRRRRG